MTTSGMPPPGMHPPLCVIILGIFFLFIVSSCRADSELYFTGSPVEVQVPVTETLSVRCSLCDVINASRPATTAATSLVGRRDVPDVPDVPDAPDVTDVPNVPDASNKNNFLNDVPDVPNVHDASNNNDVLKTGSDTADKTALAAHKRASTFRDPVQHIASMSITRDGVTIATVSPYTPAGPVSEADKVNIRVSGDVSKTTGELGYLQLEWDFPTEAQAGMYECRATGVTQSGQVASFSKTLNVKKSSVNLDDVIRELQGLKKVVHEQNTTLVGQQQMIADQQQTISDQKRVDDMQQANITAMVSKNAQQEAKITAMNAEIKGQQQINTQQQDKIAVMEAALQEHKHIETGSILCNGSDSWSSNSGSDIFGVHPSWAYYGKEARVAQVFQSDYTSPPVVFLSISHLVIKEDNTIEFGIQLLNVTKHDFIMRCGTWGGTFGGAPTDVRDLEVNWLAIPA